MTVRILFTIVLTLSGAALATATAHAAPDDPGSTVTTIGDDITIDTANPFIPENVDLTLCVGTLPRPGCGSEERGGWHQNFVAIAMITGLVIVFGRVAWGVRRSQQRMKANEPPADDGAGLASSP